MNTKTLAVIIICICAVFILAVLLGVLALLWLAYNHGVAPAIGLHRIDYWPFAILWLATVFVLRTIGRALRGK